MSGADSDPLGTFESDYGSRGTRGIRGVSVKLTSGGRNPRDLIEMRFLSSTLEDKVGHFILHLCGPLWIKRSGRRHHRTGWEHWGRVKTTLREFAFQKQCWIYHVISKKWYWFYNMPHKAFKRTFKGDGDGLFSENRKPYRHPKASWEGIETKKHT